METSEAKVSLLLRDPGPCPKRPRKPIRPKEMVQRVEYIWSSEDPPCTLADMLHLIPDGVTADCIKFNTTTNPSGETYASVSYVHEVPNVKYHEQLKRYEERLKRYEEETNDFQRIEEEWQLQRQSFDDDLQRLTDSIQRMIDEGVETFKASI